jgi:hypothetical protein
VAVAGAALLARAVTGAVAPARPTEPEGTTE